MKILIVEDQSLMLENIESIVSSVYPDAIISKALTISDGKKNMETEDFDLIITDLDFAGEKRFAIVESANLTGTPCIIFSAHFNDSFINKAQRLRAKAFVCKLGDVSDLRIALTNYKNINWWVCNIIKNKLSDPKRLLLEEPDLKGFEDRILHLMLTGESRNEIAKTLNISLESLYTYINRMIKRNECSLEVLIHRFIVWKNDY